MSYDAVNRRSTDGVHHAGGNVIRDVVERYTAVVPDPQKLNIGFPMYSKFFKLPTSTNCTTAKPNHCIMGDETFEDAAGADTGKSGTIMFNPWLNSVEALFQDAFDQLKNLGAFAAWAAVEHSGVNDADALATTAYYAPQNIFMSWLTPKNTKDSCEKYLPKVGGIMVWSVTSLHISIRRSAADTFQVYRPGC
jgi:hypothetical protein